jgi:hypothetical protein
VSPPTSDSHNGQRGWLQSALGSGSPRHSFGALLRRTLPAIGAAVSGFAVLLLAARWTVLALTPATNTTGPRSAAPPGSWVLGSGTGVPVPYHPAGQYWPLQLTLLTVLLATAAAALASGWRATRTRAV